MMLFSIAIGVQIMFAQKIFNLEDVYKSQEMYPKSLRQLQWIPQTHDYVYVDNNQLIKTTAPATEKKIYLTLADINESLRQAREDTLVAFPQIVNWLSKQVFYFRYKDKLAACGIESNKVMVLGTMPQDAENQEFDYKHTQMAYTVENDLYVLKFGEKAVKINTGDEKEVKYGHVVHRNEFGIEHGSFWSPGGNKLCFYRMDESMVADYPLVNTTTRMATLQNDKYPMAGETIHQVSVGIYDLLAKKTIYLKTGKPLDKYLCCITWSPNEKYIYVAELNRGQDYLTLNQYNAENGDFIKTIFEEKNERYVEPSDPLYFLPNNSSQFVWVSQRDGWKHLYLYDIEKEKVRQLTTGQWVVISFDGFDEKGEKIYFTSNKDEITGQRAYILDIKSGKIQPLCTENGTHFVTHSSDGMYFLDRYSNITTPACYKLKDSKSTTLQTLLWDTTSLKGYDLPQVSIGSLKNANGDDLYYRLLKPINFDSNKKYPVFYYVYGGPHSQLVTNSWLSGGHFLHYMAQKGYVVFTLDNRGTANRGFEFESTIHRRLGDIETEDQMVGVNYLKSLPYVDTTRFHIDGWSYGGFMTITLKLRHPEIFKVATAGGPVIDWKYYEAMYGERYMDTPDENPKGYDKSSLLNQVENLDGHLMIIHGAMDATVVWQNSLQFLTEAIKKGKQLDYFVYPTHEHNVRGIDRLHLWKKIEEYHQTFNQ